MRNLTYFGLCVLTLGSLMGAGCGSPSPGNSANANKPGRNSAVSVSNTANTKAEELGMLLNFTWEPEDLVWKQSDGSRSITAVFRLDEEDAKKLSDQLNARSPGAPKSVQVEQWFPPELIAGSETSGGTAVEGTSYPADDFYQAPFSQGTVTRITGTDFFVIEIAAQ